MCSLITNQMTKEILGTAEQGLSPREDKKGKHEVGGKEWHGIISGSFGILAD